MDNRFSGGYLDYEFASGLQNQLPSTKAGRFTTHNTVYRPWIKGPIVLTPYLGTVGIFYTNNPDRHATGQVIGAYGFDLQTEAVRNFNTVRHTLRPYLHFQGLTPPTSSIDHHFIFSLDDGYATLNMLRLGVRHNFYSLRKTVFLPKISVDLYTYAFFGTTSFHRVLPKAYADFTISQASLAVHGQLVYNMQETLFDRANIGTAWTLSEYLALAIEMRHRSRYDWRKADPENFIMDIERPIAALS